MYESAFSYNLTRPYPHRWFTWVVVIGGIVATALFSVLNVAAYGYDSSIIYVTNPNETETPQSLQWYQKRPWSLASKVSTFCQSITFEIGSQFYTNNTELRYEIVSIEVRGQNQTVSIEPSFTYHNDVFHDCRIDDSSLTLSETYLTNEQNIRDCSASIRCTIYVNRLPTVVGISFSLADMKKYPFVVSEDNRTQSALWWGRTLLNNNGTFDSSYIGSDPRITKVAARPFAGDWWNGQMCTYFDYIGDASSSGANLIQLGYDSICNQGYDTFMPDNWASTFGSDVLGHVIHDYRILDPKPGASSANASDFAPGKFIPVMMDSMAKIFYSYLMTDLGQSVRSNLFADGSRLIAYFNATRPSWYNGVPSHIDKLGYYFYNNSRTNDPQDFYEFLNLGAPQVNPAVLNAQYLCQVPKMKPIGSLIVSVVVADLVLLQALWVVFNWAVKFFLERRDPEANQCMSCGKTTIDNELLTKSSVLVSPGYSAVPSQFEVQSMQAPIRRRPVGGPPGPDVKSEQETVVSLLSEP